ncbi:P-loop containing protein [Fusarium mundagurra]|uniref:P-loop containing protein n=1 Tax=Fusarium mundagurra TaxID=1567541 RepID=A0A8H6D0S2_9HYPO|nr:P-loop containing protein [Fusarium mundagurra]
MALTTHSSLEEGSANPGQSSKPSNDRPEFDTEEKMDHCVQELIPPEAPEEDDSSIASSEHSEPDGLNFIESQETDDSGRDCELHVYEKRFDTRGEEVTLRVGVKQHFEPMKDKSHAAALVLIRSYGSSKELIYTRLEIRSPHLRKALRKVVKSYPGVLFDTADKILLGDNEIWCLFHYREELDAKSNAGLEFKNLWMVFKPGSLLYQRVDNVDTAVFLNSARLLYEGKDNECYFYSWAYIAKYDGIVPLTSLCIFPLLFHQEREKIENSLLERGKKYLSLTGIRYCQYRGIAQLNRFAEPTTRSHLIARTTVQQRIMVDFEEFYETASRPTFNAVDDLGAVVNDLKFTDNQFLVCDHEVPGYTMINKQWGFFLVDLVEPVELTQDAFHKLVLPAEKKEILSSLISSRSVDAFTTDDFIEGKGRGLIVLLHGPPGVGKTFTAEAIADYTQRPLLAVNSGQFIGPTTLFEMRLLQLLRLATRWQAVLLLDEADVFMQARNLQDLDRNSLVSLLLRILEYFEGILFLTTNRVETIDSAFMSRIHLALSYPPLSQEAKSQLWETWITRAGEGQSPSWMGEQLLDSFSRFDVNGRDIKNITLLGQALAKNNSRDMEAGDILRGVAAMTQFQDDIKTSNTIKLLAEQDKDSVDNQGSLLLPPWLKTLFRLARGYW